ncbi:MAG: hypothetical protein NTV81_00900 [Candidatus Komeilibacteria bacterium]|nr:hypothetical protein [Candidatus Komeilibacteria bacterium]
MNFKFNWSRLVSKIPKEIKFIIILFVVSRLVLTLVGLVSRAELEPAVGLKYLNQPYLDVWAVWDAGWYLNIAQSGYSAQPIWQSQANYAFFPLYPLMARWLGWLVGNAALAALIISGLACLVAAWYLWRLVKLKFSEEQAKWAIIFFFLFPVSFLFSGLLTESLFLALLLAIFYYAETDHWPLVGILGFFLALTRSVGIVTILPLLLIYFAQRNYSWKKLDWRLIWLLLIPLGLLIFMAFNEWLTGSWLAFVTIQQAWHHFAANPAITLYRGLFSGNHYWVFNSAFTIIILALVLGFWKKITTPYVWLSLFFIIIPLASSVTSLNSMSRYLAVIFPIFWLLGSPTWPKWLRWGLAVVCGALQLYLMAGWTRSGFFVV